MVIAVPRVARGQRPVYLNGDLWRGTFLRAWREQHWVTPSLNEDVATDTVTLALSKASLIGDNVITTLRQRFPDRLRHLDEVQRLSLATAVVEGQVTNRRMQEISERHPRDLTLMFRDLVSQGFLVPHGERKGTYYSIAEQVAASASDTRSEPRSTSQVISDTSSVITRVEPEPTQKPLASLEITDAIRAVRESQRARPAVVKQAIIDACGDRWLSMAELAEAIGRSVTAIRARYVTPLVREGRLEREHASATNSTQRYRAIAPTSEPS